MAKGLGKYEGKEAAVVQNYGYYQKDGVWYGPCCSVIVWKKEKPSGG